MPTYRNTTQNIVNAYEYTFGPGETVETRYYLDLDTFPALVKTSDLPELARPFVLALNDVAAAPSAMSEMYAFYHSVLIKVEDGAVSPADDDSVDIIVFAGYTDYQEEMFPLGRTIRFERFTLNDASGVARSFWRVPRANEVTVALTTEFRDLQIVESVERERPVFYSVAVTNMDFAAGGSVDVYVKDLR